MHQLTVSPFGAIINFDTLLMIAHDWDDRVLWERSMALLANEVVPKLPSV